MQFNDRSWPTQSDAGLFTIYAWQKSGKLFYDEYRQHPGMGDLSKNKFGNIEYIYTESRTNYYYK